MQMKVRETKAATLPRIQERRQVSCLVIFLCPRSSPCAVLTQFWFRFVLRININRAKAKLSNPINMSQPFSVKVASSLGSKSYKVSHVQVKTSRYKFEQPILDKHLLFKSVNFTLINNKSSSNTSTQPNTKDSTSSSLLYTFDIKQ